MAKKVLKVIYDATETTTFTASSSTVDTTNDTVSIPSHDLRTGESVGIISAGTAPGNLTTATEDYFIIRVSKDKIAFATTKANALAGTKISLTSTGSGLCTLRKNAMGLSYTGKYLPAGAVVRSVAVNPLTAMTSGGSATVLIKAGSTSLTAATAKTEFAGSDAFTMALAGAPLEAVLVSDASEVTFTIGTAAVTAGKFEAFITYDY